MIIKPQFPNILGNCSIKPSSDRKTWAYPGQKNTFGLLPGSLEAGGTCPGATSGCGGCQEIPEGRTTPVCYVEKIKRGRKNVGRILEFNTDLFKRAIYPEKVLMLAQEFRRFRVTETRRNRTDEYCYRIHWSGDIPDEEYAHALREAIEMFPTVKFWGYTRSFFSVPILAGLENLQWYLSLDEVNQEEGLKVYKEFMKYKNIHLSWMSEEQPKPVATVSRFVPCPVDAGKMELEGACQKCKLCLMGKPIWFKTRR